METSTSFGSWLREQRKARDWTQAQLAHMVGCSAALIRKYESGERRPSKQVASILADVLNIPVGKHESFFAIARGVTLPRTLPPHNLPPDVTSFIGRKSELELLQTRINSPECKLLVLTGPGGIGKTRLAIQASRDMLQFFPDGIFFISLVGVNSSEYLISHIATALSLSFHPLADYKAQLLHHLRTRSLLLTIDNYEHLLPQTDLITEILTTAPSVKMLITSRERLNIQGEWGFLLSGLSYPKHSGSYSVDFDTIRLFEQRAAQADSHFVPTDPDRQFIGRISELVRGHPLAIELAASWTRILSCREIAEAIQSNLDFPSTDLRNVPERHQSMNAVFEYSWKHLSSEEQASFMKLSVFRAAR